MENERMSKYHNLYVYLNKQMEDRVTLSYEKMESILGFPLPKSAYSYNAWWANGENSHQHASTWMDANYKVEEIKLGDYIVFCR